MAHKANAGRSAAVAELRHHTALIAVSALLVLLSVVALFAPGWGVMPGNMLGGGTQVTLNLATTDGSELSSDQVSGAVSVIKKRAGSLYEFGVEVAAGADNTVVVSVPSMYDADDVAESLVGAGHVEFVSQLDISDADELELLSSNPDSLTLAEGTYTAFITSDNITAAEVVTSGSGTSATYYVQVTFDESATEAFATETEELADSYGTIAVVVDGEVVATPYVSQKIESDTVTISGEFTRDEAYALAAKLNTSELQVEATVGESSAFSDICGGMAPWVSVLVLVVLGAALSFGFAKAFGSVALFTGISLVATAICGLGIMAVVALFGHVILGMWELGAGIVVALLSVAASVLGAYTYHHDRLDGASVRKSQQNATSSMSFVERCYVLIIVAAFVATFVVKGGLCEFFWALASGLTAEVILSFLLKTPLLCVFSAPDTLDAPAIDEKQGSTTVRKAQ